MLIVLFALVLFAYVLCQAATRDVTSEKILNLRKPSYIARQPIGVSRITAQTNAVVDKYMLSEEDVAYFNELSDWR